jgi:hypothetical protein
LDAADRLVRTLLDPRRVKLRLTSEDGVDCVDCVCEEIRTIVCPDNPPFEDPLLASWQSGLRDAVRGELRSLQTCASPGPDALAKTYQAIARRLQLDILIEETGPHARPLHAAAIEELIDQFTSTQIASETIVAELRTLRGAAIVLRSVAQAGAALEYWGSTAPPRLRWIARGACRAMVAPWKLLGPPIGFARRIRKAFTALRRHGRA